MAASRQFEKIVDFPTFREVPSVNKHLMPIGSLRFLPHSRDHFADIWILDYLPIVY